MRRGEEDVVGWKGRDIPYKWGELKGNGWGGEGVVSLVAGKYELRH